MSTQQDQQDQQDQQNQNDQTRIDYITKQLETLIYNIPLAENEKLTVHSIIVDTTNIHVQFYENDTDNDFITHTLRLILGYIICIRNDREKRSNKSYVDISSLEKETLECVSELRETYQKSVHMFCRHLSISSSIVPKTILEDYVIFVENLKNILRKKIKCSSIEESKIIEKRIFARGHYYMHVDIPEEKFLLESFFVITKECVSSKDYTFGRSDIIELLKYLLKIKGVFNDKTSDEEMYIWYELILKELGKYKGVNAEKFISDALESIPLEFNENEQLKRLRIKYFSL